MYKLTNNPSLVIHIETGAVIPLPPQESYGYVYQEWIDGGNTPEPASADPVQIPSSVTMRQARLALLAAGKLDDVEAAINALPEPPKTPALIEWNYSNEVLRHNGFVSQIAPLIGMTPADLDAIFIEAAKL